MTTMTRNQIKARISHLKSQKWTFEIDDMIHNLQHALSSEMAVPYYERI